MEELCASSSSSGRVKSGANQRDWSSSRSRNGDCTPVCSRCPSQLWSSNGDIPRELRAAWQRQTVNGDAYIFNGTRRAPKQALRLRFCEELCPGKQQNDGEMTETQSTRTGRKTRCHPGKHPGMLYIVTRDRGGRDDVMRKSPIDEVHDRHRRTNRQHEPRKQARHKTGEQLVAGGVVSIDLCALAQALQNHIPLPGLPIDPSLHCTLLV